MSEPVHREAIDLLLSAMFQNSEGGLKQSFMFGRPGTPHWDRRFGTEFYYRRREMIRATLFVRQRGPNYLRQMSVHNVWSMLADFVSENYWYLMNDAFGKIFDCSYAEQVSENTKNSLAAVLAESSIFCPEQKLTIYPLVTVSIDTDFDSAPFFLIRASALDSTRLPTGIPNDEICPCQFPPLASFRGRIEMPASWLGIRSPSVQTSNKMKAAVLGALALTPHLRYRHMFSGRSMFGGICTLAESATYSFGDAHTPPLMEDIIVTASDHAWLSQLSQKLTRSDQNTRKQICALEYFYRAWPLDSNERFPWLFMTLDALFGEAGRATQAFIDGVMPRMGEEFNEERIRRLLKLRGEVIHGGAPDVYDSEKYQKYYEDYDSDPINDLERMSAECLRQVIFDNSMQEH